MIAGFMVSVPFLLIVLLMVGAYFWIRYQRGKGSAPVKDAKAPRSK